MGKGSELALALVAEIERLERRLVEVEGERVRAIELMRTAQHERDEAQEVARRDHKTGLFNLRALEEFVRASRWTGYYVFADGDGIGRLNKDPRFGHDAVDRYIAEFGEWLRQQVRYVRGEVFEYAGVERRRAPATADAIATRFGGDEFIVWCSNQRGALRIRNAVRRWRSSDGMVTWSAGMGKDRKTADENCSDFKQRRKGLA